MTSNVNVPAPDHADPAALHDGGLPPRPPDYRGWAIAAVIGGILFSLVLGFPCALAALRRGRTALRLWEHSDYAAAAALAAAARKWVIAAAALDAAGLTALIIVQAVGH